MLTVSPSVHSIENQIRERDSESMQEHTGDVLDNLASVEDNH